MPAGVGRKATTDVRQPRTPREQSSGAASSPGAARLRAAVERPRHAPAPAEQVCAKKPRRKSEARRAKVEANYEQKRLRRKLFDVLPLVRAWAGRRTGAACEAMALACDGDGDVSSSGGTGDIVSPAVAPRSPSRPKRGAATTLAVAAAAAAPYAKIYRGDAPRACDSTQPGWISPEASCAQCGSTVRALRVGVEDDGDAAYCEPCWAAYDAALNGVDPPAIRAAWLAAAVTNATSSG